MQVSRPKQVTDDHFGRCGCRTLLLHADHCVETDVSIGPKLPYLLMS